MKTSNRVFEHLCYQAVHQDFKILLKEELGISDVVKGLTNQVLETILSDMKAHVEQFVNFDINIKLFKNSITLFLFDRAITITYIVYRFLNKQTFDRDKTTFKSEATFNADSLEITLTLIDVCGSLELNSLKRSLQHELAHLYDSVKRGGGLLSDKWQQFYNSVIKKRDTTEKQEVYDLAWCLYLSFKPEIMAYANGFYQQMVNAPIGKETTMEYQMLYVFQNVLTRWEDYKIFCQEFNIGQNQCKKFIEHGYREYLSALARAYVKARKDFTENGGEILTEYKRFV